MFPKQQYYIKDNSKPFILLGDIDRKFLSPLSDYCINNKSNNTLRWDGNVFFSNSHWWPLPFCFRYSKYRDDFFNKHSDHQIIKRMIDVYNLAIPIFETVEKLCSDFDIYYAEVNCLEPGQKISPHIDSKNGLESNHWYLGATKRLHIPLLTNDLCFIFTEKEKKHLSVGNIYEFNNMLYHWVENNGLHSRLHFVLDLVPKQYSDEIDYHLSSDLFTKRSHIRNLFFSLKK